MNNQLENTLYSVAYQCYLKCYDYMYTFDDFKQEALIYAYKNQGKPDSHIVRGAKSHLLMIVRKKLRYFARSYSNIDIHTTDTIEHTCWLSSIYESLPDIYRPTFTYLYWHGANITDTAEMLGLTRRTVTNHNVYITKHIEGL